MNKNSCTNDIMQMSKSSHIRNFKQYENSGLREKVWLEILLLIEKIAEKANYCGFRIVFKSD